MNDFKIRETDNAGEVVMEGALTISNAGLIRTRLLEMMEKSAFIRVTIADDSETDISFLQVLCSANISASRSNKSFRLGRVTEEFVLAAGNTGFKGRQGCACKHKCLWNKGGIDE